MEPCDRDNLDQWLDRALRHYGRAEPTAELEGRILKHLREQRGPAASPSRWLAFAALAALAGVFALLWVERGSHRHSQNRPSVAARSDSEELESPRRDREITRPSQPVGKARPPVRKRTTLEVKLRATSIPKLDQFPSRRPLSREEEMLRQYVREFPDEAALVAREQAQLEMEREKWFAESARENRAQEER